MVVVVGGVGYRRSIGCEGVVVIVVVVTRGVGYRRSIGSGGVFVIVVVVVEGGYNYYVFMHCIILTLQPLL